VKQLTKQQARRVAYEAERAYLVACGRGGMPEWHSVPESIRSKLELNVHPAPFDGTFSDADQNAMRRIIYDGVLKLLAEHTEA
jgi:hypothetical protein